MICRGFLLSLLLTTFAGAQDGTSLLWKFSANTSERFRLVQTAQLELALAAGQQVTSSLHREFEFRWTVVDVSSEGTAIVSIEVSRTLLKVKGPGGQETVYDSSSKEEPRGYAATLAPLFRTLMKSELSASLSDRGSVTDLQIADDLEIVLGTKPVGKALGTLGTREDLIPMIGLAMPLLPAKPLELEGSWEVQQNRDSLPFGSAVAKSRYELQSVENEMAEIRSSTEIRLISSDAGDPAGEITSQECSGKIRFDLAAGMPVEVEREERLEIETDHGNQPASGTIEHRLRLERLNKAESGS